MFDQLHIVGSELTGQGKGVERATCTSQLYGYMVAIMAEEYVHSTGTVKQISSEKGHLSTCLVKVHNYGYHGYNSDGN